MAANLSVEEQLRHLGEARNLVLRDPGFWPQVLGGTLPMITGPTVEVRRWGADFLAETFSTPVVNARAKQELAITCLDTLLRLSNEMETGILKSVVQCSASIYPIIFRHMYVLSVATTYHYCCPPLPPDVFTLPLLPHSPDIYHTCLGSEKALPTPVWGVGGGGGESLFLPLGRRQREG